MNPKTERLDPDWTCFVCCPYCHVLTFACCDEHAIDVMYKHLDDAH